MTTREDITHNQRVTDPIEVTVYDINTSPPSPRDVELKVTDRDGNRLKIVLWNTHDISGDWEHGETYTLVGGRGKRYSNTKGLDVSIHSNDQLVIERLESRADVTRLLLMGDTHIGYRHRSRADKSKWAYRVDAREGFQRALDVAQNQAVDAIIHAGDVFDHGPLKSDHIGVTEALVEPLKMGIPFYYVRGNHDRDRGMKSLRQFAEGAEMRLRLNTDPMTVGEPAVNLFGIDHTAGSLPSGELKSTVATYFDTNILVLHETPYPVVDDQGSLLYTEGADVGAYLDALSIEIDLVVTGHMHVGRRGTVRGHDVPLVVTGPTAPISAYEKDNQPSVWLVTISEDGLSIDRQELGL